MAFTNPASSYCTTQNHTPTIDMVDQQSEEGRSRFKAGKRLCLDKEKESVRPF